MEANTEVRKVQFRTNRGLVLSLFLNLITLGLYNLICMSHISSEINAIASKHDYGHTMHYCLIWLVFSWLSLGIVPLIWYNNICGRIGQELCYRNLNYSFGSGTFWGWRIFGTLIIIGPFIFYHKFFKAMNVLNSDYNLHG